MINCGVTPEGEAQAAICDYLTLRRVFFFRCNNLPRTFFDGAGNRQFRRLPKYTPRGIADILAVKDGRAIFIEVKNEKGKAIPGTA